MEKMMMKRKDKIVVNTKNTERESVKDKEERKGEKRRSEGT